MIGKWFNDKLIYGFEGGIGIGILYASWNGTARHGATSIQTDAGSRVLVKKGSCGIRRFGGTGMGTGEEYI